ncbi:MAG: FecR domain-containing protein [Verrucomicrobiota bacterium]
MKAFSFLKISASLLAFAALLSATGVQAANPGAADLTPGVAKILDFKGTVTFVKNGKVAVLQKGDTLGEKDTVSTVGVGSEVKLDLGDNGGELNVVEDTTVVIDSLKLNKNKDAETTLDLKKGGLIGNVKKLSAASKYEVKHAQGVAGIRGTLWAVLPGQGVICAQGSVLVTFVVNGVALPPITLGPGQMVLPPAPGQAPIVINIPPALATRLAIAFNERGDRPGGPRGGRRDVRVIVSAFAGAEDPGEGNRVEEEVNN